MLTLLPAPFASIRGRPRTTMADVRVRGAPAGAGAARVAARPRLGDRAQERRDDSLGLPGSERSPAHLVLRRLERGAQERLRFPVGCSMTSAAPRCAISSVQGLLVGCHEAHGPQDRVCLPTVRHRERERPCRRASRRSPRCTVSTRFRENGDTWGHKICPNRKCRRDFCGVPNGIRTRLSRGSCG